MESEKLEEILQPDKQGTKLLNFAPILFQHFLTVSSIRILKCGTFDNQFQIVK